MDPQKDFALVPWSSLILQGMPPQRQVEASSEAESVSVPDHELIQVIGRGSYGEVWLARNLMGVYRAVKVVYRKTFEHESSV